MCISEKFYCVYCGCLHDIKERTKNGEHIVALQLGGSKSLVIYSVCTRINNLVGSSIEGKGLSNVVFDEMRRKFKIKSQKGRIPDLVLCGYSQDLDGRRVRCTIDKDNSVYIEVVEPFINIKENTGTISYSHSDPEVARSKCLSSLNNINKKRSIKGLQQLSVIKTQHETICNPIIHVESTFDLDVLEKCFVKIALAFGDYVFGLPWSASCCAGGLRSFLSAAAAPPPLVWCEKDNRFGLSENEHLILITTFLDQLICNVCLFGGMFSCYIIMSCSDCYHTMEPYKARGVVMDVVTQTHWDISEDGRFYNKAIDYYSLNGVETFDCITW